MKLFDFIVNLSIFSLLVSIPVVIRSFINPIWLKRLKILTILYSGSVSVILVMLSFKYQGYSYDIRYAPVILVFAYFGPISGIFTGLFSLLTRLYSGGNWLPAIIGWTSIMLVLSIVHTYMKSKPRQLRMTALIGAYVATYLLTIFTFQIVLDQPFFHLQYVLFVMFGVILGGLLIESSERLLRIIAENKAMELSLEVSESQYRLIANHTSDLIMVLDQDHSMSYFSPSHEHVLGYSRDELADIQICKLLHPDDLKSYVATISMIYQEQKPGSVEFRMQHKQGHWIEFESRCVPVEGNEHIVIISRDISDRKKAEEILVQSEKLAIVGELAAGIAHEIRNPLTTIKGFLQVYKDGNYSRQHNELLLSELEHIEAITTELLSLAKPQIAQLTLTDVRDLIGYTVEIISPQASLMNINLRLHYESGNFSILCEKNQLKQMLLNLLKNAMEAMPAGGDITLSVRRDGEHDCIISVQDQGCGIPEALLSRLGQPFYSLKEKGTGLGLMISHKIIKQHHGDISYQSKVNEGTLIEIRLPLHKVW